MSWMARLYETYEQTRRLEANKRPMPISHTVQNAHIKIVIDGEGNFKSAKVLEKEQIILPATEASAGRSSGEAPHPLADKLQYVAKDYALYGGGKKPYFESYASLLNQWCDSPHAHPKAKAVQTYVKKGEVIKDLVNEKIIYLKDGKTFLTRWESIEDTPPLFKSLPKKGGEIEPGDALVCWTVEINKDPSADTWKDESLYESWILFDAMNAAKKGFCFVTGNEIPLATSHPSRIRHTGDMAKLISSNDMSGYTYRGRFVDDQEACGVSFEVTQKAHNALRWLVKRQGYRNGDQVILAWAISKQDKSVPELSLENLFRNNDADESYEDNHFVVDHGQNFGQQFATRLNNKIRGYLGNLDGSDTISILGLDSASPGRMSISYYRETNAKEFYEKIEKWHAEFAWPQPFYTKVENSENNKSKKSKLNWVIRAPLPMDIVEAAYGSHAKDSLKKNTIERILSCILEGNPFPRDLVLACVQNASNPNANAYQDKRWLWQKNISIACALYRGYCSDRNPEINKRRNYAMSLERDRQNRDYLYGRLLAVAEQIERFALQAANENRITSAERYMQQFSIRPFTTWKIIHDNLISYKNRLRVSHAGLLGYWEKEIKEICDLFQHGDFIDNNNPLTGEYLLGYYCQKSYSKNKDSENENESNALDTQTT